MHLGLTAMNNLTDLPPDRLALELEGRGFESLWFGEHSQIPVARRTPYPAGGDLPAPYRSMMDPFLSLLLAATATDRLVLGTGVALPLERDLFALAKTAATLDHHCSGRFEFGVGVGWNVEELANHRSVDWSQRYRALRECIAALKALWSDEEAEFHGEFFDFDPVWSLPKPKRQPHPPVLSGMSGRIGTRETVAWADGWMPVDIALGDVAKKIGIFRRAADAAGRDADAMSISLVIYGDPDLATLTAYRDLGVDRAILGFGRTGWTDPATTLPFLDRYAPLIVELE